MIESRTADIAADSSAERLLGCSATPLPAPNLGRLSIDERVGFLLEWLVGAARADSGAVLLTGTDGLLHQRATVGLSNATTARPPEHLDAITWGLIVHDVERHPDGTAADGASGPVAGRCDHWLVDVGARMALSLPLEIQGQVLGVVRIGFAELVTLEPSEVRRIGIIADHIAAVAEADRLSRETAHRHAQFERVSAVLHEVDRMKGDFLSMVSHELRTPLTAIIGYTDLLLRQVHGSLNDRQERHLHAVKKAAHRLLGLVNDLLDLNRLECGHIVLAPTDLDLVEAVRRAIGDIADSASQRDVQLRLDVPARPVRLKADAQRLHQVLVNLLDNAVKFTSEGGTVSVRIDVQDREARVAVLDTGVGVPPEQLGRIWDRFHQADSSSRRLFGGTGLGLAIVKHIIELHGGTVTATSDGTGQGSCFGFSLPLAAGEAPAGTTEARLTDAMHGDGGQATGSAGARPPTSDRGSAAGTAPRRTILVVDDEPDNRDVIRTIAEELLGFRVLTAASGTDGLVLARTGPDLILLDLRMPDLSGFEVARLLQADPATAATPIIAITALDDADDRQAAIEAGCRGCLPKPFSEAALAEVIAEVLRQAAEPATR